MIVPNHVISQFIQLHGWDKFGEPKFLQRVLHDEFVSIKLAPDMERVILVFTDKTIMTEDSRVRVTLATRKAWRAYVKAYVRHEKAMKERTIYYL